jgi:AraC-like DNA-binding protein
MKHVLQYIHEHIADDIEVETLARIACVTKTYFIRLFKQEFGLSPVQYINKKRVERSQLLLFTTDLSVREVAYQLGISDHSYFCRLFRKMVGITPKEYRCQQRT